MLGWNVFPRRIKTGADEKSRSCFILYTERLGFGQPGFRPFAIAHLKTTTAQEVWYRAHLRKCLGLMQELKKRFQRAPQLKKTIRQAEPPSRSIRRQAGEYARQLMGRIPIPQPCVDSPAHDKNFRVRTVEPGDFVCFCLRFHGIAQLKPTTGRVQAMLFQIIELSHGISAGRGRPRANHADLVNCSNFNGFRLQGNL